MWSLQKGSSSDSPDNLANLAPIVFGKAQQIYDELHSLLDARKWADTLDLAASLLPVEGRAEVRFRLILRNY